MDTNRRENDKERFPPDSEAPPEIDSTEEKQDSETEKTSPPPVRPRSRPDFGSIGCLAVVLTIVLLFGWLIVSAIADVAKEEQERKQRRNYYLYSYQSSHANSSSSGNSSSGGSSGNPSSGGSSSFGSSGSTYKPKKSSGNDDKDPYNAADFGNAEDFYDEHYDDFFDYYDAEDYWNDHNES